VEELDNNKFGMVPVLKCGPTFFASVTFSSFVVAAVACSCSNNKATTKYCHFISIVTMMKALSQTTKANDHWHSLVDCFIYNCLDVVRQRKLEGTYIFHCPELAAQFPSIFEGDKVYQHWSFLCRTITNL
jgi:hypothetical protein